jgi:hypothetical protein
MRRFVAVDLETTGVDPYADFIARGRYGGGGLHHGAVLRDRVLAQLPRGRHDRAGAAAVNGWGKRDFGPKVSYDWAAAYITSQLNDVFIVGKVPWFDASFLESFLNENGLEPVMPWHHRLVDVGCSRVGLLPARHHVRHRREQGHAMHAAAQHR